MITESVQRYAGTLDIEVAGREGFDTLERILGVLHHRLVLEPVPESSGEDVALAEWFLSLTIDERINAWESWLQMVDEAEVSP